MPSDQDNSDKRRDAAVEAATLIDPRVADLWAALWSGPDALEPEVVGGLLRLAYLTGYQDALTEEVRGELFRSLGLPVPDRLSPRPAGRRAT